MADRVALITGAGSGIGRATALAFLADGYRVVLAGRHKEPLEETAKLAEAATKNALAVQADVTDPASVHALFARVHEVYGRLDVLFNNAGVSAQARAPSWQTASRPARRPEARRQSRSWT